MVDEWMGQKLQRSMIGYRGIPFVSNPYLVNDLTIGTTTDGGTVWLVYFDVDKGYHFRYLNAANVNVGASNEIVGITNDESVGSEISVPWYYRELPESESGPYTIMRMDGWFSGICRSDQAIAAVQGFTD
jgi:hypothetical protein